MPLQTFLRYVSDQTGLSIIAEQNLDAARITLDVVNLPVDQVLGLVGRRVGAEVSRTGTLFYLGTLKAEDKGVLVRRVRRLKRDELREAVEVLLSEHGKTVAFSDGVLVVGDRVEVLQRVEELLTRIEGVEAACWVVQLYLVSVTESDARTLGLDVQPALEVAATFAATSAASSAAAVTSNAAAAGALQALLKATREGRGASVVAQPLFVIVDGGKGSFSRGQRVPIAQKSVSNQGTVQTSGYSYVNAGLSCDVELREQGHGVVGALVNVERSAIVSYVEAAPVTSAETFKGEAVLHSGGVYLLGCLDRVEQETAFAGWLSLGGSKRDETGTLQVWCRVYRIGAADGPAASAEPPGCPTHADTCPLGREWEHSGEDVKAEQKEGA
jgi:hypothetical protein